MALIDHTSSVIYMRDADGRYMLVNREYERLFGLRREDIVGLTDHDLFPLETADAFRTNDRQALAGGVPIQMEEQVPGDAGNRIYLTVKFPLIDEAGTAYAVAGISTDITERSRAVAALRDSEERFRLLAEHAQDIIFRYRLEPDPAMEYMSRAVQAVTGHTAEEFYADPRLIFQCVDPADRQIFEQSWRNPRPGTLTVRLRRNGGDEVWIEQRASTVTDDAGRVIAVEGILRDVSERLAAERDRAELEQQLRQAERLDSLGQLAGGIAHDFNNILAVISGYADMLVEELGEEHFSAADAAGIKQAAARGAALTRQLLIFSRSEPSQPEMLDLNAVAVDMQRLLARTLGEDIEVSTMLAPELPAIVMDRSKLEQVVMNAALNSRAAMPGGGHLTITTALEHDGGGDDLVCLSVIDTGVGMPPEVLARAFEPFFTTRGRGSGTGLGLATAYGVVTDAGGTISLESEQGKGTTLRVRLPAGTASTQAVSPAAPTAPVLAGDGWSILVVEDEEAVRDIVCRLLGKAGYQVFSAPNPAAALDMCRDDNLTFDVLLTDVIMPGMSGTQLAAELRRDRPDLPVLFMSGYTSGPAPGGQELPADAPLIRKPFETQTLLNEVHRLISQRT
ncbi:hybrid sensor histidine kinase/response regulator [Actinoplanes aureus]|uniref:histidine kinase n=1 Tax=Actinoplanes aureus TaxID=2792083 RepID=A0A931CA95_9ACTN|nr:PAS domain-containing sensor histidine kinase [Actinoplanes aureus]MBG0565024.1 PAS domain-containing protein [Actinoplanes aureus]